MVIVDLFKVMDVDQGIHTLELVRTGVVDRLPALLRPSIARWLLRSGAPLAISTCPW